MSCNLKKLSLLELCQIFQIPPFQSLCMVNSLLQVKLRKVTASFQPKSDPREVRLCFPIIIIIIHFTPPTLLTPQKRVVAGYLTGESLQQRLHCKVGVGTH